MMGSKDLSTLSLILALLLLIIPLLFNYYLSLNIGKKTVIAVARMCIQLFLIGIFLSYIFELNNVWLNSLWVLVMIVASTASVISSSNLQLKTFSIPIFFSISIPVAAMLLYFNTFIVGLDNIFDAKYLIAIGGMILGNLLSGNIIGLNNFLSNVKKAEKKYLSVLALGADRHEALRPYISESIKASVNPIIASIATIGLVSLPGMMTGQILGGASPAVAVKYQMAIMIAIFVTRIISIWLALIMTIRAGFDNFDILKRGLFKEN